MSKHITSFTTHSRRMASPIMALMCATICAAPSFAAQEIANSTTGIADKPVFQLSAKVNDLPKLTRDDIDPASMQIGQPVQPPEISMAQSLPILPALNSQPTQPNPNPQGHESDQQALLKEYNVNWSSWISHLADRWYFVLTQYENGFGMRFVTERPALIEFTCHEDGSISDISLKQSSGAPVYDRLQMIALSQVAPLPAFPPGTKRTRITLVQGWESHERKQGESDFKPGSFGKSFPMEKVSEWVKPRQ